MFSEANMIERMKEGPKSSHRVPLMYSEERRYKACYSAEDGANSCNERHKSLPYTPDALFPFPLLLAFTACSYSEFKFGSSVWKTEDCPWKHSSTDGVHSVSVPLIVHC